MANDLKDAEGNLPGEVEDVPVDTTSAFTLNRVVVLLTPVFAGLSGYVVQWIANHFPGTPGLDQGELTALFVAGATAGLSAALAWIHGHHQDEQAKAFVAQVPAEPPVVHGE